MNNSSFETFLDQKFIPMSLQAKVLFCLVIAVLLGVLFFFIFFKPKAERIDVLEKNVKSLESELELARIQAAGLEELEEKVAATEERFLQLSALLPKEKEIPQLLKDISSLGRAAGLDFNTFRPEAEIPQDFYKKIPITIKVRGPYHNMGYFFDQVSKLQRIVSVTNVRMGSPERDSGEMLLQSDCQLLTYQFSNEPLPKPEEKKK
ncbi:MAG: pilus assembly protein PilO [Desulfobacterales bacterium]|nr:MAG: pilus assembly protein PilO [Desulfobacterales bacterium]